MVYITCHDGSGFGTLPSTSDAEYRYRPVPDRQRMQFSRRLELWLGKWSHELACSEFMPKNLYMPVP